MSLSLLPNHPNLLARVEKLLGAKVDSCRAAAGGYTPALRLVCATARGSFFVKVGVTPSTAGFVRQEIAAYQRIRGEFLPRLTAWQDDGQQPLLILEDLSSFYWPPPWTRGQVERTLAQVELLHRIPAELQPFAQVNFWWKPGWQALAQDPRPFLGLGLADDRWLASALPALTAAEAACPTEGTALCHYDLRSDNICLSDQRVLFVDWNLACLSNPRLDLGFWLPSLAAEGGPAPQEILPDAPEVAAAVSGYLASRAGLPDIPEAPRVRWVQRQQLRAALPWVIQALGLDRKNF